jgi:Tfp pilus assembly protein PilO
MTLNIKTLDRTCLALVVIVSLICGYWVMSRVVKQQRQIRQENNLLSKRLKDLNLTQSNLKRIKIHLDAVRSELKALNQRIPESTKIGEVLKQIDFLMKEREIVLVSTHPLPTIKEKLFTKIPIRLVFKGAFVNIYHLLHDLETMNRMLVMEKMIISRSNLAEKCRVELTAVFFERKNNIRKKI